MILAKEDLTIDVNVAVAIPPETAKRCVDIINMYLEDTGRKPVIIRCIKNDRLPYYKIDVPLSEKPFNE